LNEKVTLSAKEARWQASIVQQPAATNASTLILEFNDDPPNIGGPAWYEVVLSPVATMLPPFITEQPVSRTVLPGTAVRFSVTVGGTPPLQYQWRLNGVDIPSATNAAIKLEAVREIDLGTYTAVVTNPGGTIESAPTMLRFPEPPAKPYHQTVRDDAPIAYWRLDEPGGSIALDSVGPHDGLRLNGGSFGHPGALLTDSNTAARFVATQSSRIEVPFYTALNPARFTVELWAKVTAVAVTARR
jgi:hypothetical protein